MARYGGWEDRPGERREGGRDWERWRREQEARGGREHEPWAEHGEGRYAQGREDWREADRDRWGESREDWRGAGEPDWRGSESWRGSEYGGRPGEVRDPQWERRTYGAYGAYGPRSYERPGRDRPWLEPSPDRRQGQETRGLVEWEDRGPLAWLRDKTRDMRNRRRARGPKGYSRTDERIEEDVCERIARSGVDADEVEVKVENREVTLTGSVSSREEKWWLESLADDVFGVEEVHNRLRVSREAGRGTEGSAAPRPEDKRDLPH
jgi:hypothetical protein